MFASVAKNIAKLVAKLVVKVLVKLKLFVKLDVVVKLVKLVAKLVAEIVEKLVAMPVASLKLVIRLRAWIVSVVAIRGTGPLQMDARGSKENLYMQDMPSQTSVSVVTPGT